ncbi:hypothetical protein IAD21_02643 [Abditibacteriota bacterium]|nr:hypothetical protein IAD21_02643 [Abditibacteriota bacterium]
MLSLGSISRADATLRFPFLAPHYSGRRAAIRDFTHRDPDFVFWIYPDGKLCNAHNSHLQNPPRGFEYILSDEPHYGGFLRGRVASLLEDQLVVVYCEENALAQVGKKLNQFIRNALDTAPLAAGRKERNGAAVGLRLGVRIRRCPCGAALTTCTIRSITWCGLLNTARRF